ncbi:MAG: HAD family phosphatase [Lachnospiraceae bacterium]|nr:HAD family phosphatase [Lachnospiraceae bacterium]
MYQRNGMYQEEDGFKYAIWDLDGTLLDSLSVWLTLARRYLEQLGITDIPQELEAIVDPMSLEESADYLRNRFRLPFDRTEIISQFMSLVRRLYEEEIPFFEEARNRVLSLYDRGCRMCVLTTTDTYCAAAALKRGGIWHCFEQVYTCSDLKLNKRGPEIYMETCKRMGFEPEETVIYEDADYALESAGKSGCQVINAEIFYKAGSNSKKNRN